MTVKEIRDFLNTMPADAEVSVLYPEDHVGEALGVSIEELEYYISTNKRKNGVFIRMG